MPGPATICAPGVARKWITPFEAALISNSIFIDSIIHTVSPDFTEEPSATTALIYVPATGAARTVAPTDAGATGCETGAGAGAGATGAA